MSDVRLVIGSTGYGGWTAQTIDRSIETLCGGFELTVTERYAAEQAARAISIDDPCRVAIDGATVITGFVDEIETRFDKDTHEVTVRGRDATGDIVDSSAFVDRNSWQPIGTTFLGILKYLLTPFNIRVTIDPAVDISAPFNYFKLQPGETVFEAIDRGCRMLGVLPVADGLGGLLITQAGSAPPNTKLSLGGNILSGHFKRSNRQRFSQYIALGQPPGQDGIDPSETAGMVGIAYDKGVARYRPLVVIDDFASADLTLPQRRAQWEASVRFGRAWRGTYPVQGWRDAAGALWRPNALVQIDDDFSAVHETLLISRVKHSLNAEGEITELTVTRRESFLPEPLKTEGEFDTGPARRTLPPGDVTDQLGRAGLGQ